MRGGLISCDAVSLSFELWEAGRVGVYIIATWPVIASFIPFVFMRVAVFLVSSSPIVAVSLYGVEVGVLLGYVEYIF